MRRISVWIAVVMIVIIAAGTGLGVEWNRGAAEKAAALADEENINVTGTVKSAKLADDCCRLVVDSDNKVNIIITVYNAEAETVLLPGTRISAKVKPSLPEGSSNPGTFDYARYLKSEDIFLTGSCGTEEIETMGTDPNPLKGILVKTAVEFRYKFSTGLAARAGEEPAGLFAGMLFGDKSGLASETYESFQKNGTAHILSVSGLHVGIIYGTIMAVFGKRRKSKAAALTSAVCLFLMAFLASFSVSVVRAITMIYIKIIADLTHRRYDLLSAASVTAILFLIKNPMSLYSTGFILSFSAVVSLAVVGSGLDRMVKSENPVWKAVLPVVSIQLGMAPLTAVFFNYFSLAAFVSNIPVIFLSGIMIPAGFVLSFMLLAGGGDPLSNLICDFCSGLSEMLVFFNDFTGAYGALSFSACSPGPLLITGYYAVLILVFSEYRAINSLSIRTGIVFCAAVALVLVLTFVSEINRPQVVFLDVGQGDCIHIRTPEGNNFLVDGGGSLFSDFDVGTETIKPYLLKNCVDHLDGVFITHMDADHYKGISGLNTGFRIDNVYLYEGYKSCAREVKSLLNLDEDETEVNWLKGGMSVRLGKEAVMNIIYPNNVNKLYINNEETGNDNADLNSSCLVMKLDYRNTRVLFTGDISAEQEKEVAEECSCDIVKVPHHGSRYSSSEDFVKSLGAKAAVIEVGKNNFGHPDKSVIERYEESGIIVYRTDSNGAVSLRIKGTECRISVRK